MSPSYGYHCANCDKDIDIVKSMKYSSQEEFCDCKAKLERVYTSPQLSLSVCQFQPHYNWGLGKALHKPEDVKEEMRRVKGETGKEIVEVGNDKLDSIKKQRIPYTY